MCIRDSIWYNGPSLPSYNSDGCMVTAPPSSKYSVILSGGTGNNPEGGSNFNPYIMALSKDLTKWTHIERLNIDLVDQVAVMIPPNYLTDCRYDNG